MVSRFYALALGLLGCTWATRTLAADPCAVCARAPCAERLAPGMMMMKPQSLAAQRAERRQLALKAFKLKALPSCAALNDMPEAQAQELAMSIDGCREHVTCFAPNGSFSEFVVEPPGTTMWHICPERECGGNALTQQAECACRQVYGTDKKGTALYDMTWPRDKNKRLCNSRWEMKPVAKNIHDLTDTYKALGSAVTRVVAEGNPCTTCPECTAKGEWRKFPGTAIECMPRPLQADAWKP